jgi:hypothetical protein
MGVWPREFAGGCQPLKQAGAYPAQLGGYVFSIGDPGLHGAGRMLKSKSQAGQDRDQLAHDVGQIVDTRG